MVGEGLSNVDAQSQRLAFCYNCGRPLPHEANFCPSCGARLLKPSLDMEQTIPLPSSVSQRAPVHLEPLRMSNPNHYGSCVFFLCFLIPGFFIGFLWGALEDGFSWEFAIFSVVFSLIVTSLFFIYSEVILHPREIELTDAGVIIHQKLGRKQAFVPWTGVAISFGFAEPAKRKWHSSGCALRVSTKKFYSLHWTVGEAVRERYKAYMGYYPPDKIGVTT